METGKTSESEIVEVPYVYRSGEYLYTCGEISKFFKEIIDNKRLFATKCPQCGIVWMPPRGYCPHCYSRTDWVPLSGKGTVQVCSYCYFPGSTGELIQYLDIPYVQALIKLDGADTYLMSAVATKEQRIGVIKEGMRVKAAFREQRKGTVADFYFVPDEGG